MSKPAKFRKFLRYLLLLAAGAGLGVLVGAVLVWSMPRNVFKGLSFGQFMLRFLPYVLAIFLAYWLQLIVHEAGHLVFGLISGYRFVSFRVGRLTLVRTEKGFSFRRLHLAGTGGQCLMAPPPYDEGRFPFTLYNLGGVLMNLIFGFLCALCSLLWVPSGLFRAFLLLMALFGLADAVINGIPMRPSMVSNDGMNLRTMRQDEDARRAFWLMLEINRLQTDSRRLRDMPDEWFTGWTDTPHCNDLTFAQAAAAESRLLSQGKMEEAKKAARAMLPLSRSVSPHYRVILRLDLVFIDLILRGKEADLSPLSDKEVVAYTRQMASYLSVLRVRYAEALIGRGDTDEAARILSRFERSAASYPLSGEMEDERALVALAQKTAEQAASGEMTP